MRKKRRQNFIDSHVQGSLLRRILFHWLIFFVVACLTVVMLHTLLGDPNQSVMTRVQNELGEFVFMGVILLSLFPAFLLDTVRFSNRFVGPIARLRRCLRELGENQEVETLVFREQDFWADMANDFNSVADVVRRQNQEIAELKSQLGISAPQADSEVGA